MLKKIAAGHFLAEVVQKLKFLNNSIIFCAFVFLFSQAVFPQTRPDREDFDQAFRDYKAVFDYHFSRADREINPGQWLETAMRGRERAFGAWEAMAAEFSGSALFLEIKEELNIQSEAELEERFSQWLLNRFFGAAVSRAAEEMAAAVQESHLRYTYHLDEDGNILHDEKTGDPLVIRPGENDFDSDRKGWLEDSGTGFERGSAYYGNALIFLYPELLASVPEEKREAFEEKLAAAVSLGSLNLRKEFENMTAREERLFTARRTGDVWSLRKKSEDEEAAALTARLIEETEQVCRESIASLEARIEEASAGAGDLVLAGAEWLEEYREQFGRGLKAWEEAEERFFVSRIEWEQEAGLRYTEGEKAWTEAYKRFEAERQKWEQNAAALFESAEALFMKASENLEKAIKEAKAEFEKETRLRVEAGSERAKAWVDMYVTSGGMVAAARENIQFWNNWNGPQDVKKKEIEAWTDLYDSYIEKALEARSALVNDFNIVMGTGALADVLSEGISSEDFNLDEYQIELIRAKTVAAYWEKRLAIAEAVSAYAEELTAGRMTDAEGVKAWEDARSAYDESVTQYEYALEKLRSAGAETAEAMEALNEASLKLRESDGRLSSLNEEYSVLSAVLAVGRPQYIQQELISKYQSLLEEYNLLNQSGEHAAYLRYLEYGLKLGIAEKKENSGELLKNLIAGDGQSKSLSTLKEEAERICVIDADGEFPQAMEGYGLSQDNPYYETLEELLALGDGDIIFHALKAAKKAAETDLEIRLRSLDLFTAASGADWYFNGRSPAGDEREAFESSSLENVLRGDVDRSFAILLAARLSLELEGLEFVLGGESERGKTLAGLVTIGQDEARRAYEIFAALKERLSGGSYYTGNDDDDALISAFISGGSFFSASSAFLGEEENAFRFAMGMLEAYQQYASGSIFAERDAWLRLKETLDGVLDVKTAAESILNQGGDAVSRAVEFFGIFDNLSFLPQWLKDEAETWKFSLMDYVAAEAVRSGRIQEDRTEEIGLRLKEIEITLMDIAASMDEDEGAFALMSGSYEELYALYGSLYLQYQFAEKCRLYLTLTDGGTKSWREYISEEYLGDIENTIPASSGQMETALMDLYIQAERDAERLRHAFLMYDSGITDYHDEDLAAALALYTADPHRAWDEGLIERTPYLLSGDYKASLDEYRRHLQYEKILRHDLENLGMGYDYFKMDVREVQDAMKALESKIAAEKVIFEDVSDAYSLAAILFSDAGAVYDELYSLAGKAYADMEEKRHLYDKEDAIRRWASTAYLGIDNSDIEKAAASLERANIVLAALTELYQDGEERRPYKDEAYEKLYNEYRESFGRMMLSLRAEDAVNDALLKESENNKVRYSLYMDRLDSMKGNLDYTETYLSPANTNSWTIKDLITVREDGRLAFSLTGISAEHSELLAAYFASDRFSEGEQYPVSSFEEAIRGLSDRMASYFTNANKYSQWGLARDWLVRSLFAASGIPYLKNQYDSAAAMAPGTPLGNIAIAGSGDEIWRHAAIAELTVNMMQLTAWNSLTSQEKADLEFYTILTLSGGGGKENSGFSMVSAMNKYHIVFNHVAYQYDHYRRNADTFGVGYFFRAKRDIAFYAYCRMIVPAVTYSAEVASGNRNLRYTLSQLNSSFNGYLDSCKRIEDLKGESDSVDWDGIRTSLTAAGGFTEAEIEKLHGYWDAMISGIGGNYTDVPEALDRLSRWSRGEKEDAGRDLEIRWREDEEKRLEYEDEWKRVAELFVEGNGNPESLKDAARAAFGVSAPARKNHLENLEAVLMNDLGMITESGSGYRNEYISLSGEYSALITRAYSMRYDAELAVREAEWNEQRRDIAEKYAEWKKTASVILERGREDWKNGAEKMQEAFSLWVSNYTEEYARINDAWNAAYLAGLQNKEAWLNQAALAAERASAGALLTLVGDDAEMMARAVDTRIPLGFGSSDPEKEADEILSGLLEASGIRNMEDALASAGSTGTLSSNVRTGLGGPGVWDSGAARIAAVRLARESNAQLALRESKRLAAAAQQASREAVLALGENVDEANNSFRKSMDEMFILGSQWMKAGNKYIKDIIVNSTLFESVITNRIEITGYMDYIPGPVQIKTNLSESYLDTLDVFAIQGLIQNVYAEVEAIASEIFGFGEDKKIIEKKTLQLIAVPGEPGKMPRLSSEWVSLENRYQDPGKFGSHIGYAPLLKKESGSLNIAEMFYDTGSGELGRLLSGYYYWEARDHQGVSMTNLAVWDKPLWDSRGSFFSAPTIRSTFEIASQAGAAVVAAAMAAASPFTGGTSMVAGVAIMAAAVTAVNVADDLFFAVLDTAGGYKRFDEAAFDFGKKALVSGATSVIGGVFGGVPGISSSLSGGLTKIAVNNVSGVFGQTITQTVMSGLQAATTAFAASAINGIQYSREGGWSYSIDGFTEGLGGMSSALSAMAGTAMTGTMGWLNSHGGKLGGFSPLNQKNVGQFNSLLGGFASESVSYAFSGDFAFNLANIGLLPGLNYNSGLLEMHAGKGFSMNFGTSGVNISPEQLYAAANGAFVWGVNIGVDVLAARNNLDAKALFRSQYGFGDKKQKNQLYALIAGKDKLLVDGGGNFEAETKTTNGARTVVMHGYREGMSLAEQMGLGLLLGHEAYRDGIVSADNYLETRNAVNAHTVMALRMLQDGQVLALNQNILNDLYAYLTADGDVEKFNAFVDNNYDSTGDFWKLMNDGNILFDGSKNLYDADGNLLVEYRGDGGYTASLASVLGVDFSIADTMLKNAGLTYMDGTFKRNGIDAKNNSDIIIQTSDEVKRKFASAQIDPYIEPLQNAETGFLQSIANWAGDAWNAAKGKVSEVLGKINSGIDKLWSGAASLFDRVQEPLSKPEVMVLPELSDSTGGLVMMPGEDSYTFWSQVMTEKTKTKYDKENHGGFTQCNIFFSDIIKDYLGSDVYNNIFTGGLNKSNTLFEEFKTNPNLERINTTDMRSIQEMADSGILVFMVYKNPDPEKNGHIAFVGNSGLTLSATEAIPDIDGKRGSELDPDLYWPVLAQAGERVGIIPMAYGTNDWNLKDKYNDYKSYRDFLLENNLYFYTVKGGM